ncbi:hypothetical protein [Neobacillus sp. LXY-4]|uniref:hypothetical protein n=1 Tax=Neobacillus sp. LXY-4 TaxID=3379826 RepID=UPI003EE06D32
MKGAKWSKEAIGKIDQVEQRIDRNTIRKLKLDLLKKVILRVEEFSVQSCTQCEENKENLNKLITIVVNIANGKPQNIKEYNTILMGIIKHLKKAHGLVERGQYMNQWIVLGLIFGVAFIYFSIYAVSFGLMLGIGIGAMLDEDAKKKGKLI